MKKALVLSGGGAKGSYQVGVYQALKELKIKIDIITGTSIGSINGAIFTEKRFLKAKKMWLNLTTKDLFGIDLNDKSKENYKNILKEAIDNKGLSFDTAKKYLETIIDEAKIRNSNIDYGLVTYSYKNKRPLMLTKESIPRGKMLDYIIASSSCFPFVTKKQIDDDILIDGGYYDNLPINLAIEMGADEVIAVDLSAIGFRKEHNNKKVKIETIKCKDNKTFILDFDKDIAKYNMAMGYQDTMKHYKALDGNIYTFKKNNLSKNYNTIKKYYISILKSTLLFSENRIKKELIKVSKYNDIFKNIKQDKSIENIINESLEYLGEILDIDKSKIYDVNKYNKELIKHVKELSYLKVNKKLKGKMLVGYMYNKYVNTTNYDLLLTEMFNMALVFPKEFLATVYLISISEKFSLTLKNEDYYEKVLKTFKGND